MSNEVKQNNLFEHEEIVYSQAKAISQDERFKENPLFSHFIELTDHYKKLLRQSKTLVKTSDLSQKMLGEKTREIEREKQKSEMNLESLISIGNSLSVEKDSDTLLRKILFLSKKITGSDAGSIFLVEENGDGSKVLRFKYSKTFSKELPYEEFTIPFNTQSIAGYVAVTGRVLNIPDVYNLNENDPVSFNPYFDQTYKYRTKSMLVVPMRNHYDKIIGVVQLINSKEHQDDLEDAYKIFLAEPKDYDTKVVAYDSRYEILVQAIASQAAIALENNRMMRQIEEQFEQFAKASVTAIESRDPATSGHSFRVAAMCVAMARAINREKTGPFADICFSDTEIKEIEYAGLLHDFGKVYIDAAIFLKAKKLFPSDYEKLMTRLALLYRSLELEYVKAKTIGRGNGLTEEQEASLFHLREIIRYISDLNEPTITDIDPFEKIAEILHEKDHFLCTDLEGNSIELLTKEEIDNLCVRRGTLNEVERKIIESHVEHTYTFVSKIPWPDELKNIPEFARKHHEKLDGSGYPDGIVGKEHNPIQSRIMAIADLFDALAASDRPYKKSVPLEKCLDIMRSEANAGKLDADLVELFIHEKAYALPA